jgi:hypothetical protein
MIGVFLVSPVWEACRSTALVEARGLCSLKLPCPLPIVPCKSLPTLDAKLCDIP